MTAATPRRRAWPLYLGVFTTSMSVLLLEIALTRIFSVSLWYHLAFMVISTALLGFGASGTLLAVRPSLLQGDLYRRLRGWAALFSLSVVISFGLMVRIPLDPLAITEPRQVAFLLAYYVVVVLPYFFAGLTLGTALSAWAREIGSLYFADLLGAGLGCLAVVAALYTLPGQGVVLLAALGAALAALLFGLGARPTHHVSRLTFHAPLIVYAIILSIAIPLADRLFPLYIPPSKPLSAVHDKVAHPELELVYTGWTPFARVDVMWEPNAGGLAWGLSGAYSGYTPEELFITIDAAAITTINRWSGDLEEMRYLNYTPASLAYQLRPGGKVLTIGPGGGVDVLTALYNGAEQIVGVEINPLIVDLIKGPYREFSGGLYTDYPQVDIQVAEGRNFVSRSPEQYDVIQFSQVDTWAAASSGAYSLSENYLYTVEAFHDYLDHLTPDGLLTVGRWYFEPPRQAFRLVTIGATALEQRGIRDSARHFAVVRAGDTSTVLMKKSEFTAEEIARLREICKPLHFQVLYAPDMNDPDNWFVRFFQAEDRQQFYRHYPLDVTPTTDDRPFFFEYYGWTNFGDFRSGKLTLTIILAQALVLAAALILWPLYRFRRAGLTTRGSRRFLTYFAALGIGFMFVEMGLMQRFILYLGHPTYSLSVVLFALLVFSGLGSFLSGQLWPEPGRGLRRMILLLGLLVVAYIFLQPSLFRATLPWPLPARAVLSIGLLAPLGLCMGMPFPLGVRLVEAVNRPLIPWAWGVNGFGSVLGSILAVMLAQSCGFSLVMGVAVAVYLLGLLAVYMPGAESGDTTKPLPA